MPLPYQADLSKSTARVRGIIGGNRTGKTEWGARECYYYLTGTHPDKDVRIPNEVWIGTPSFDTQVESAQPKLLKFLKADQISRTEYYQGNKIKTIYLKNGSKVTFKSFEQSTDKWAGAEKRLIWFDEEPPHNIWTEAVVRHGAGIPLEIIFTLTPINGMTWIYDELWSQAKAKGIDIKTPQWEDNTHLTKEQLGIMTSMLSPEELEVRRFGRFVRKIGLVCPWWRRDIHIKDMTGFNPRGYPVWVSIDFGFSTAATAALFGAIVNNAIYIFDGIYEKNLTTPYLAQKIKERLQNVFITGWIADSAQAADIEELKNYGFPVRGIKKETGTSEIDWDTFRARKMMEYGQLNPVTGEPRIYIADHLIADVGGRKVNWLANEIENLRWKQVKTADGLQAKQQWGDQPKDAIDALSYLLVSLPTQPDIKIASPWGNYEKKSLLPKQDLFDENGLYI